MNEEIKPILVTKEILCRKCEDGKHFEDCLRTVEKDVRDFKLKKNETLSNYAHFQTGLYKYVFRCTCPCIRDPLYQISYYGSTLDLSAFTQLSRYTSK